MDSELMDGLEWLCFYSKLVRLKGYPSFFFVETLIMFLFQIGTIKSEAEDGNEADTE